MFIDWYTAKCINFYFWLWMKSAAKVEAKSYFPWLMILIKYDKTNGCFNPKERLYRRAAKDLGIEII